MTFTSRKMALPFAISTILLTGCFDSANNDQNPIDPGDPGIGTPGRTNVSITLDAPVSFYPIKTLTQGEGTSLVSLFTSAGYTFEDTQEVAKYFVVQDDEPFEYNMQDNKLMVAQSYNPDREIYFQGLVGFFNPDESVSLSEYFIDPLTDALADLVLQGDVSPENGLTDEFQAVNIGSLFALAGENQLVLEGLDPEQASSAPADQIAEAVDRLFTESSSPNNNYQEFIYQFLDGSTWSNNDSSMEIQFSGDQATYTDPAGDRYSGSYQVGVSMGDTQIRFSLDTLGEESASVGNDSEGMYFTFLSNRFDRQ